MSFPLNLKDRGTVFISLEPKNCPDLPVEDSDSLKFLDLCYRTLCAVMFNHASSGHPGGSVSSGRIVESLIFNQMNYDISNPMDRTADIISYAAGHKALGLYAMRALRNEMMIVGARELVPKDLRYQRQNTLVGC